MPNASTGTPAGAVAPIANTPATVAEAVRADHDNPGPKPKGKPDAIRVPMGYHPNPRANIIVALTEKFREVLDVERVYVKVHDEDRVLCGDPAMTMLFPSADARHPMEMYTWHAHGPKDKGVRYGYLVADDVDAE